MDTKHNDNHDIMGMFDLGDHGHDLLGNHEDEGHFYDQEEQKSLTSGAKRKGRPKGLKTGKGKIVEKVQKNTNKKSGHWTHEENKKYHWFLQIHSKHFITKQLRRMDKIFKIMSDFIGTRQAQQCRSHHQKMQKKFKTFYKILKSLRNQFYLCISHENVKQDLQNNEIYDYDPLITQQGLNCERQIQKQQNQVKQIQSQMQLQVDKSSHPNGFFFCDNYENHFGNI